MTDEMPEPPKPEPPKGFVNKRREKIVAEIERNRRGEHKVPTWVLVVCLVALLAGLAAIIIWGG
jgi:hypothetical protein